MLPIGTAKSFRSSRRGFTLLEIVVVLAIVAILAVFAVPAMVSSGTNVSTGAEQVTATLAFARSEAIAKRTVVRFGIVTGWDENESAEYRKYSLWAWDRAQERYRQIQNWETLPQGLVFETRRPKYIARADYAKADPSSSRGDYVTGGEENVFTASSQSSPVQVHYLEFKPSGRAGIEGGDMRNILFSIVPGTLHGGSFSKVAYSPQENGKPNDWAQFNIDTLTGRVRYYRP